MRSLKPRSLSLLAQVCRETQRQRVILSRVWRRYSSGTTRPRAYCLVTDISEGGVRLYLNVLEGPDEFVLLLSGDGPAIDGRYRVVWREGDEVGAKYVS